MSHGTAYACGRQSARKAKSGTCLSRSILFLKRLPTMGTRVFFSNTTCVSKIRAPHHHDLARTPPISRVNGGSIYSMSIPKQTCPRCLLAPDERLHIEDKRPTCVFVVAIGICNACGEQRIPRATVELSTKRWNVRSRFLVFRLRC